MLKAKDNEKSVKPDKEPGTHRICVLGAGYVGGTLGSVIACWNPHLSVKVVDKDEARIAAWKSNQLPIHERHLLHIVQHARTDHQQRHANLSFSTSVESTIRESGMIFICVGTPLKSMEHSAGKDYSLEDLLEACVTIARNSTTNKIIVQKSTGPIGLAESIEEIFQGQAKQGVQLEVLSNPEFLSQGSAVQNLLWPSRVIIGSSTSREGKTAAAKLRLVYRGWVKPDRIYFTDRRTAELTKLASNTLLAQKISSINALSSICESERCNIDDIAKLCGADSRIGPLPTPSLGFGGSCLRKDVLGLSQRASRKKLPAVASYFDSIVNVNEFQTQHCVSRVVRSLVHLSTTPSVAVLGFSFKKETTDVSETSVVPLTKALQEANIAVRIYDPQVSVDEIRRSLGSSCAVEISSDAYEACKDAHAIVIATDWPQFVTKLPDAWRIWTANSLPRDLSSDYASKYLKNRPPGFDPLAHRSAGAPSAETRLDWRRIASLMKSPRCVFDFCDVADRRYLRHLGFVVETIGLSNEQMEREPHVKEVAFIPSS